MDTDFIRIQQMRQGREDALEAFVRKYYPKILQYCRVHIADAGYAEDLTQETFVRFFGSLDRYRHYGKAANYLYVIAANLCRDFYRKNREIPVEELPEEAPQGGDLRELQMDVRTALEKLPEEIRAAAILYYIQGERQRDIARILGIRTSLVKYRIARARQLLAAELGKEEI